MHVLVAAALSHLVVLQLCECRRSLFAWKRRKTSSRLRGQPLQHRYQHRRQRQAKRISYVLVLIAPSDLTEGTT
jgi:hypothetical protein